MAKCSDTDSDNNDIILTDQDKEIKQTQRREKAIHEAKLNARPELRDDYYGWTKMNYANSGIANISSVSDNIERVDANRLSLNEFYERYEIPSIPLVLHCATDSWMAHQKWTLERLSKKYRNQKFRCGEDTECYGVKLKMKYYTTYCQTTKDDSPMYIFDANFGEHHKKKSLLEDYKVPSYFEDDLFRYIEESRRPPYRWFVLGPSLSGTGIHIDPLGTSAWNAVIKGHKHWCIFPPSTPKELIKPRPDEGGCNRFEASTWFKYVYPRCLSPSWPKEYKMIDFIHGPGQIVYIPGGWWHVVLNLDCTIAVTQNLVTPRTFLRVYPKAVKSRTKMAKIWLEVLKRERPEIAALADNEQSNYNSPATSSSSSYSSSTSSCISSEDENENVVKVVNFAPETITTTCSEAKFEEDKKEIIKNQGLKRSTNVVSNYNQFESTPKKAKRTN